MQVGIRKNTNKQKPVSFYKYKSNYQLNNYKYTYICVYTTYLNPQRFDSARATFINGETMREIDHLKKQMKTKPKKCQCIQIRAWDIPNKKCIQMGNEVKLEM